MLQIIFELFHFSCISISLETLFTTTLTLRLPSDNVLIRNHKFIASLLKSFETLARATDVAHACCVQHPFSGYYLIALGNKSPSHENYNNLPLGCNSLPLLIRKLAFFFGILALKNKETFSSI